MLGTSSLVASLVVMPGKIIEPILDACDIKPAYDLVFLKWGLFNTRLRVRLLFSRA